MNTNQIRKIKRFAHKLLKQKNHIIAKEKLEINEMQIHPSERCQEFVNLIRKEIFHSNRMKNFLHKIGCPDAVVGGTVDFLPNTSKIHVIVGNSVEEVFWEEQEFCANNPLRNDVFVQFENLA